MKKMLSVLALVSLHSVALAAPFRSFVINSGDSPLTITVPAGNFIIIRNFSQEGGIVRGVITATLTTSSGTSTANVLNAAIIDTGNAIAAPTPTATPAQPETMNLVTIAGPAMISIPSVTGGRLFITYRKESQPDS